MESELKFPYFVGCDHESYRVRPTSDRIIVIVTLYGFVLVLAVPHVDEDVQEELEELEAHDDGHAQIEAEGPPQAGEEALSLRRKTSQKLP